MYENHVENRSFNLAELLYEYRLTSTGDSWGDCMCWLFAIADEMYFREGWTPEEWEYRPSPLGPTNDPIAYESGIVASTDVDELYEFGQILFRLSNILRARGLDY